ncbi:MAG: hypothetical protein ACI9LV_000744 [Candidatus Nanohaloarchaea archaeon]|jgi:hypothetical protein
MKGKTQLLEEDGTEFGSNTSDIGEKLEEADGQDTELEIANELLEPEENVFSKRLPTLGITKAGYFAAKPEDWLLSGKNEPTDNAFFRNFGLEIGAGAVIGAVGAHAFDPTGLYTQALTDPDPVNIGIAATAGLVGNSLYGAAVGGAGGGIQNVARSMLGATLAASGATYSFMTNNALRGLEQAEKYLRANEESELADYTVKAFDKVTSDAEALYDRLTGNKVTQTYSPESLDELEEGFRDLERFGEVRELETSFQVLTDKSEISEIIDYLQNEDEIEVRDEDIQIEETQKGRTATYRGEVDFAHNIEGENYRSDDYAIEFEAIVNKSDIEKIKF